MKKSRLRKIRENYKMPKVIIESVYVELEGEELDRMVAEVEEASERSRHKESWHLINSISGRKSTKQGIIKGSSRKENTEEMV